MAFIIENTQPSRLSFRDVHSRRVQLAEAHAAVLDAQLEVRRVHAGTSDLSLYDAYRALYLARQHASELSSSFSHAKLQSRRSR